MHAYRNLEGHSGVEAFEIGSDSIIVKFRDSNSPYYRYTYASTGKNRVNIMKRLAMHGRGLSTFISTDVKDAYESKW